MKHPNSADEILAAIVRVGVFVSTETQSRNATTTLPVRPRNLAAPRYHAPPGYYDEEDMLSPLFRPGPVPYRLVI